MTTTTNSRQFGIEIEGYNIPMHTLATALNAAGINCRVEGYNHNERPNWKIVSDGSLAGLRDSFELVSPILSGESGVEQIRTVCRVLNELGGKVNRSCGLHVHVNAADLSLQHLKNTVKMFTAAEKMVDEMMPESRRANYFCKSVVEAVENRTNRIWAVADAQEKLAMVFKRIQSATSVHNLRALLGHDRYHKLNLESLERHRTVEFRQHGGTMDANKIIAWVDFCTTMVERATMFKTLGRPWKVTFEQSLYGTPEHKRFFKQRRAQLSRNGGAE